MQSSDNAPMTQVTYVARVQSLQRSKMTEKFANKTGNFRRDSMALFKCRPI